MENNPMKVLYEHFGEEKEEDQEMMSIANIFYDMKIKNITDLNEAIVRNKVPHSVSADVLKRILDHILSGGNIEDPYIIQQYKYIEKVIRNIKKKEFTQRTLDKLLEEIITEYFSDESRDYGYSLWEVIHAVKAKYLDEIETLPQ